MTVDMQGLRYCILTFGCQMNKHDSERIAGILDAIGCFQVDVFEDADIAVFMTCCVREAAETRLFGQIASYKNVPTRSDSPLDHRIIAIGGCIAQRDGEDLLGRFDHVDVVFGTQSMASFSDLLKTAIDSARRTSVTEIAPGAFSTDLPTKREKPWAAWLPIMTGCNNFCSYCIVPYVRGREQSRPLDDIVAEAERYVHEGVKEITLLGQNVNSYGTDIQGSPYFAEVLQRIDATGIERLRFVTSHPKDLSDEVIDLFATLPSLMPALHLPFQSGSDRILELMNRSYTSDHYRERIAKLREACPDIALSTDIIVGFPGETEDDFQRTCELVQEGEFAQAFTFIYSPRSGTPAARMSDDTPAEIIQDRFDRLVEIVQTAAFQYNQQSVDHTVPVLIEGTSKRDSNILAGKSPWNQTVHAPIPEDKKIRDLVGTICPVHIDMARTWYLSGTLE